MPSICHTILLVESAPADVQRARFAALQCQAQCDLQVQPNAYAAWDYLVAARPEQSPFILFLNLNLPHLDGLAVLRALRLRLNASQRAWLVYLANFTQAEVLQSYRADANCFVAKAHTVSQSLDLFAGQLVYWRSERNWLRAQEARSNV
jgi:DNA-binding NarL/FixJ family response regulator